MSFSHQVNNIAQHLLLYIQFFFCTTTIFSPVSMMIAVSPQHKVCLLDTDAPHCTVAQCLFKAEVNGLYGSLMPAVIVNLKIFPHCQHKMSTVYIQKLQDGKTSCLEKC